MTDDTQQPALTAAERAKIRARADAATPGPWGYNSYSAVHSTPMVEATARLEREHEVAGEPYDDEGEPSGEWAARFAAVAPAVARVPPSYGDTATGRHAADAAFIAAARIDVPRLLDALEAAEQATREAVEERDLARLGERAMFALNKPLAEQVRTDRAAREKAESERDALRECVANAADSLDDGTMSVQQASDYLRTILFGACMGCRAKKAESERDALAREVGALRAAGNDLASALETAIMARQRLEHWSLDAAVNAERFLAAWRAALAEDRPAEAGEG